MRRVLITRTETFVFSNLLCHLWYTNPGPDQINPQKRWFFSIHKYATTYSSPLAATNSPKEIILAQKKLERFYIVNMKMPTHFVFMFKQGDKLLLKIILL